MPTPSAPPRTTPDAPTLEAYGLPAKARYTYADYQHLPEGAPFQLIDGDLVMSPAPTLRHQRIIGWLFRVMSDFVDEHDLGEVLVSPVDVHLSDTDTFQPDIVFLTSEQRTALTTPQEITGGPALVVEVLSPSTGYYDLTKKKTAYARHGVRAYWIVDPGEDTVEVLRRDDDGGGFTRAAFVRATGTVRSRVLDGFTVDVAALFDR